MRGDMDLHPRHFVYTFSGVFSGATVQYFINKVLFSDDVFFSQTNSVGEVLFFVLTFLHITVGFFIDDYVVRNRRQMDYRTFLLSERIVIVVIDLMIAVLLGFTVLYQ